MVECASIAFGLWAAGDLLWSRLSIEERDGLVRYLLDGVSLPGLQGNWLLFRVLTHAVLRSFGVGIALDGTVEALDLIDSYHRGHGWYTDGGGPTAARFDYYTAWSMNLYPLLWAVIEGDQLDPGRTAQYRQRSSAYLADAATLVGADGAPLHQGRSLTYRAAMTAPFWAGELADVAVEPGLALGLSTRVLDYFDGRGGFDDGLATLGWHTEFLPLVQSYSGPGSPLWLSKAFLGLLLPPDSPAWTTTSATLPIDRGDVVRFLPEPGWLIHGTARDGVVRVLNHGTHRDPIDRDPHSRSYRDDPLYARLGYSTVTGPIIDELPLAVAAARPVWPDNSIAVIDDDGGVSVRRQVTPAGSGSGWVASTCLLVSPERESILAAARIVSVIHRASELRLVCLDRRASGVVVSGWAISGQSVSGSADERTARGRAPDRALHSRLSVVLGGGEARWMPARPTAFGPVTGVPVATFATVDAGEWLAVHLDLAGAPVTAPAAAARVEGAWAIIDWNDGSTTEVELPWHD